MIDPGEDDIHPRMLGRHLQGSEIVAGGPHRTNDIPLLELAEFVAHSFVGCEEGCVASVIEFDAVPLFDFTDEDFSVEMWVGKPKNPVRYMLKKHFYADPGEKFYYRDTDPQLIGHTMTRLIGKTEKKFADKTLFKALNIHDYYWEAGPDGVNLAAHGLHLLPRDLAKLGQLVLNQGLWQGERVVSAEWIEESTKGHVDSEVDYSNGVFPYGYYWWVTEDRA